MIIKNSNKSTLAEIEYDAIKKRYTIPIIIDYILISIVFICCIWAFIESSHVFGWILLTLVLTKIDSLQYYYQSMHFARMWCNEAFNKPQQSSVNTNQL